MFNNYNGHELIIMMRKHATMRQSCEEEKATNYLMSERNFDLLCVDGRNYSLHPCFALNFGFAGYPTNSLCRKWKGLWLTLSRPTSEVIEWYVIHWALADVSQVWYDLRQWITSSYRKDERSMVAFAAQHKQTWKCRQIFFNLLHTSATECQHWNMHLFNKQSI